MPHLKLTSLLLLIAGSAAAQQTPAQRSDCLTAHNDVRRAVTEARLPDLTYDAGLESAACRWSRFLAENGKFEHSNGKVGRYGENLHKITYSRASSAALPSCRGAAQSWAREKQHYAAGMRVAVDGVFSKYGHFTQQVWPTTKRVGCCGWRTPDGRSIVWTCEYDPPGNFRGAKAY